MRFNKKAALDLSINSIVVLILAITMLGLGLGFMYKMFGGTTEKLEKMSGELESQMKEQLKESGKRLALETTVVEMKKSTKKKLAFALKNDLGENLAFQFGGGEVIPTNGEVAGGVSATGCYQSFKSENGADMNSLISITTPKEVLIKGDEVKVLGIEIEAKSAAQADTYQCSMVIGNPQTTGEEYSRVDFEVVVK